MDLLKLLAADSEEILNISCASLSRAKLKHYNCSEDSENRQRLKNLLELSIECISKKKLLPIISYMEETAKQRYYAGFDFSEVHAAVNVLEETIWNKINSNLQPDQLGEALGLISTVLGAAKENLARTYISLASKTKVQSLDLNAIFGRE